MKDAAEFARPPVSRSYFPRLPLSPRLILFLVTAFVLLYGVIYPNLYLIAASFQRSGSWTLANYREVLTQRIVIDATLVIVSFAREGSWTTQTLPSSYTFSNYVRVFTDQQASEVFVNSFLMSAIAAMAALLWSFCVVTVITKRAVGMSKDKLKFVGQGWNRLLSLLVLVPWALPGTVVAVSAAEAYGKPSLLMGSFILVGTFWILPFVYFLRFMPLVVRAVQASMEQIDPTLDEAARATGASAWQRLVRVTLPLVWPGAIAGTLLAFVIALGEYVASVLVFVPANRPISIAIASELRDFHLGTAAAYGVVLVGLITISMTVAAKLERLHSG